MVPDTWNCINDAVSPPVPFAAAKGLLSAPTFAATKSPFLPLSIPSSVVPPAGQDSLPHLSSATN